MMVTREAIRVGRRRGAVPGRPVFALLALLSATLFALVAAVSVSGTERVDSGWAVASPSSALDRPAHADPGLRIAINHILEQGRLPLLQAPAQAATAPLEPPAEPSPTASETDGWRPAQIPGDLPTEEAATDESAAENGPRVEFRQPAAGSPRNAARAQDDVPAAPKLPDLPLLPDDEPRPITNEPRPEPPPAPLTPETTPPAENAPAESRPSESSSAPAPSADDSRGKSALDPPETQPLVELTKELRSLRTRVRRVLKSYYNRPLNSRDHDPWEAMHGMLAYGLDSRIRQGGPQGKTITAVGWLCYNKPCKGLTLLYATKKGELRAKYGVGLQGHMGQFLAMLAQCRVSPDYPIHVGKRQYTIHDLIEAEKVTCYSKSELTFKLIALMHYLDSDAEWVNDQGVKWSIPKLIHEELAQPIRGAACGGTHRLAGLSLAARTRVRRGEPLDGEFLRAAEFVEKYHNYAFQMQNRDGSLSTQWFRGRGADPDIDRRVKTTGHILEWLCYSLSDEELHAPRTIRAVSYLTNLLASNYGHEWEVGPMCHAIHALKLYDERVFQPHDGEEVVTGPARRQTAKRSPSSYSRAKQR